MLEDRAGGLTRSRTLFCVLLVGLVALALKPYAPLERGLDLLFLPARWMPELAAPLRWLSAGELRAAERELVEDESLVRERARALVDDEQDASLPSNPVLRAGRRFVHGEVRERVAGARDRVVVHLANSAGVQVGLPVVSGEYYVGRVDAVDPDDPSAVVVKLVTAADTYVGAVLLDERGAPRGAAPCQLVVGGLGADSKAEPGVLFLAVHNPSRDAFSSGRVVVRELLEEPWSELAGDYTLGRLVLRDDEAASALSAEPLTVRAGIDFESGLFHVLVVLPEGGGPVEERLSLDTYAPEHWTPARALSPGDASAARDGLRVALPFGHGVRAGAALVQGGHLLGRVAAAAPLSADVRRLGDRGLRLAAIARVEGEVAPRPLGRIESLGRGEDGALSFRWEARVPIGDAGGGDVGERGLQAEIFTGPGERGVPRGLFIGRVVLPEGPGPHVLRVERDPATAELVRGYLWRGAPKQREEQRP